MVDPILEKLTKSFKEYKKEYEERRKYARKRILEFSQPKHLRVMAEFELFLLDIALILIPNKVLKLIVFVFRRILNNFNKKKK